MNLQHVTIGRRVTAKRKFGPLAREIGVIRYLLPNGRVVVEPSIGGMAMWHSEDLRLAPKSGATGEER